MDKQQQAAADDSTASVDKDDQSILLSKMFAYREAYHARAENPRVWHEMHRMETRGRWVNMDPTDSHFIHHVQCSHREDGVEMHAESHPLVQALKLPSRVVLLQEQAKRKFKWYKKRECERRRRYRADREIYDIQRKNFMNKKDQVTLADMEMMKTYVLSILERCEFCGSLSLSINLFWGTTLCDECYFNPVYIREIMKKEEEVALKTPKPTVQALSPSALEAFTSFPPLTLPLPAMTSSSSSSSTSFILPEENSTNSSPTTTATTPPPPPLPVDHSSKEDDDPLPSIDSVFSASSFVSLGDESLSLSLSSFLEE